MENDQAGNTVSREPPSPPAGAARQQAPFAGGGGPAARTVPVPTGGEPQFYGNDPAPWFDGPEAPLAGETEPAGIYGSLPLASPAAAGAESILLDTWETEFAGKVHRNARIRLVRADSSLSDAYVVVGTADAGDGSARRQARLHPAVQARDAGAVKLRTRGEPVPPFALGTRPAPWREPYTRPETARGHAWELPGPHALLGWGNASAVLTGTE
jgi:hypothetical protein